MNSKLFIFIFFFSLNLFSQKEKSKYNSLTRFTIGFHKAKYESPEYSINNQSNGVELEQKEMNGFFIDYRLFQLNNFSFNIGYFYNNFSNNLKFNGYLFDPITNDYELFDGEPYPFKE